MKARRLLLLPLLAWGAAAAAQPGPVFVSTAAAGVPLASLEGRPISSVRLVGNRTQGYLLAPRITLRVGQPYHDADRIETRRNLYAMRLFKKVRIDASANAQGGVDVVIEAVDGWYVVPIPLVFGGPGGSGAGLSVTERNYFGDAESLYASGDVNSEGGGGRVGGGVGQWSGDAGYNRSAYTQYGYSNGSFNTENFFENSKNLNDPSQYGVVVSSFNKSVQTGSASAQYVLAPDWRAGLGFNESLVSYGAASGAVPDDAGHQNWAEARLSWSHLFTGVNGGSRLGIPSPWSLGGGSGMAQMIGSIFGMGLADLGERLRPLPEPRLRLGADATVDVGGSIFGSDFDFERYTLATSGQYEFTNRDSLSLRVVGSEGVDLPFSQEIPTNGALGLRGTYIREFLGDQGAGASLAGSYLLHQSRRGVLSLDAFVESASVSGGEFGGGGTQNGVGGGFHYTFWRFPLPLGLGYTYSLTDHDGQVSFAAGGRFGG